MSSSSSTFDSSYTSGILGESTKVQILFGTLSAHDFHKQIIQLSSLYVNISFLPHINNFLFFDDDVRGNLRIRKINYRFTNIFHKITINFLSVCL